MDVLNWNCHRKKEQLVDFMNGAMVMSVQRAFTVAAIAHLPLHQR